MSDTLVRTFGSPEEARAFAVEDGREYILTGCTVAFATDEERMIEAREDVQLGWRERTPAEEARLEQFYAEERERIARLYPGKTVIYLDMDGNPLPSEEGTMPAEDTTGDLFSVTDLRYDYPADRDEDFPTLNIVDVADVMRNGANPPEMLVQDLIVVGLHHIIFGPKEQGKTWLVLGAVVAPLLQRGQCVVYIDKEMSRTLIAERLDLLGVPADAVAEHLVYLELPSLTEASETRRQWAEMLTLHRPALVLADASAGVLADAGLNENQTPDVLKWDAWYFGTARRAGAATVMLDHTGHDTNGRARGASGKGAAAKVEFEVKRRDAFDRTTQGMIVVTRQKNTAAADIPEVQAYELGGTPFTFSRLSDSRTPAPPREDDPEERAATLRARVLLAIMDAGDEGVSASRLTAALKARRADVYDACKELAEDADSHVETRPKNGGVVYSVPAEHRPAWE